MSEDVQHHASHEHAPRKLERAAAFLSAACALHCLLVPVVTAVLPAMGASQLMDMGAGFDVGMTLLVVASVAAGAAWGFRRHRDVRVTGLLGLGLLVYLLGHALEGTRMGLPVSIVGALVLAFGSYASSRLVPHCDHAH